MSVDHTCYIASADEFRRLHPNVTVEQVGWHLHKVAHNGGELQLMTNWVGAGSDRAQYEAAWPGAYDLPLPKFWFDFMAAYDDRYKMEAQLIEDLLNETDQPTVSFDNIRAMLRDVVEENGMLYVPRGELLDFLKDTVLSWEVFQFDHALRPGTDVGPEGIALAKKALREFTEKIGPAPNRVQAWLTRYEQMPMSPSERKAWNHLRAVLWLELNAASDSTND
jgi:hypothetical protein